MRERLSFRNPQGRRRNTSTGSDRQSAHPISGSGCRNRPAELRKRCIASIPNDATSIAETGSLPVSRSVLALPNRISTTGCRRQIAAPPRQNGPPPRKDRKPEAASRLTGTGIPGRSTPADSSRARSRRQIRPNPARNSDVGKSCVSIFREDRQVKNSTSWPTPGQYCIIFASGQITKQKFI